MKLIVLVVALAACSKPVTHAGPYVVRYDCITEQSNGTRASESQTLDLGTHTRTTRREGTLGEPVAQHAPDMIVQMASDAVARVLAGSGYQPEPAAPGAPTCTLSIMAADKTQVFEIEKSDVKQKDAVTELVHVFRP